MPMSPDQASKVYIPGLKNIHAVIKQGQTLVDTQLERLENYSRFRPKLESHRVEKNAQLARVESILERHGVAASTFKEVTMKAAAGVAIPTRPTAADEVIKNSFATLALARCGADAYEILLRFAEAAGDTESLPALQQSLSEERSMVAFVEENLHPTGMRSRQGSHGARYTRSSASSAKL